MDLSKTLSSKRLSFNELQAKINIPKRELKQLLHNGISDGVIGFNNGNYFLVKKKAVTNVPSSFDFILKYKWLVFSVLVFLNFVLLYAIGVSNSNFVFGLRDSFLFVAPFIEDFSLYTVTNEIIFEYDSGLLTYLWPYLLIKLFPAGVLSSLALFFSCLFTLVNITLALSVFRSKWSFIVVPLAFLLMPTFEFPSIFVISFFLLALKFRSKPYVCSLFCSFCALLLKQYMIVPCLLLLLLPYMSNKGFRITKTLFFQLLIFFAVPLVFYLPFNLSTVFTAFSSLPFNGFNWFSTSYLFVVLLFIVMVAFRFFKSRDSDLLLVLISAVFILFCQFKVGATYYLGVFSVFFLMFFFSKSSSVLDKCFLFIFTFLFFLTFVEYNNFLLVSSFPEVNEIFRGALSFFDGKDMLVFSRTTVHPLWFNNASLSFYTPDVNISSFDGAFFKIHYGLSDNYTVFYNKSHCLLLPFFWSTCTNCKQFLPVCFNNRSDMAAAYFWFTSYYSRYADDICVLSPYVYRTSASFFPRAFSKACNDFTFETTIVYFFTFLNGDFIVFKNFFLFFLIGIYLFKGFGFKLKFS